MSDGEKNCLTLVVALVIFAVFGAALFVILQKRNEEKVIAALGADTFSVCNPPVGGNANIGNFPLTQGPFKSVVIGVGQNSLHDWQAILPAETKAQNRAELDLVFCVGEKQSLVVENCPYYRSDGSLVFTVQRTQPYVPVTVINPATSRRIADVQILGGIPKTCEDQRFDQQGSAAIYEGNQPDANAFLRTIWEFIYRDTSRR